MVVHLIDGTYELFRHFYGARRFNKGRDRPFGAVVGVLQTVLQMLETGGTHLGVATDHVNIIGTFIEGLTRLKGDLLPPFDLHDHGAFQHIDECVRVMAMDGVLRARGILHDQHIALLTGDVA